MSVFDGFACLKLGDFESLLLGLPLNPVEVVVRVGLRDCSLEEGDDGFKERRRGRRIGEDTGEDSVSTILYRSSSLRVYRSGSLAFLVSKGSVSPSLG